MSDNFSLEDLLNKLSEEQQVEIDWNAPEAGSFPPAIKPGVTDFVFRLREDTPFDSVEIEGSSYLKINFDADILVDGETKTLTYQSVTTYKHPKMAMSGAASLARSLNIRTQSNPPTNRDWVETFQAASGRARGRGEIAWRFYDKEAKVTYSTSPRKRNNKDLGRKVKDQSWSRNADGSFVDTVTDSAGRKQYGQAEFINFFTPAAEANGVGA